MFGGKISKFGKSQPFISLIRKKIDGKMERLDMKVIENESGGVSDIKMFYHPPGSQKNTKIIIVVEYSLIVLEIKEEKIHQLSYFKNLHNGNFFFLFFLRKDNML